MEAPAMKLYRLYLDDLDEKEHAAMLSLGEDMEQEIERGKDANDLISFYSALSGEKSARLFIDLMFELQDEDNEEPWPGWHFWVGSYARRALAAISLRSIRYALLLIVVGVLGYLLTVLVPLVMGFRALILVASFFLLVWGLYDAIKGVVRWLEFRGTGWPDRPPEAAARISADS